MGVTLLTTGSQPRAVGLVASELPGELEAVDAGCMALLVRVPRACRRPCGQEDGFGKSHVQLMDIRRFWPGLGRFGTARGYLVNPRCFTEQRSPAQPFASRPPRTYANMIPVCTHAAPRPRPLGALLVFPSYLEATALKGIGRRATSPVKAFGMHNGSANSDYSGIIDWHSRLARFSPSNQRTVQTSPLVSVAMPVYNGELFIREAIQSVLSQTYPNWELIVVNDGSSDATLDIVSSFQDPRIRIVSQANQGRGRARARAMRLGRGDLLAFLDADDLWHRDMLSACVTAFQTFADVDVVHTDWRYIDQDGKVLSSKSYWQDWRGQVIDKLILELPFVTPGIMIRRSALLNASLLDENTTIIDDWDMWLELALRGCIFHPISRPLVYYRRHQRNSTQDYEMFYRDQISILDRFLAKKDIPDSVRNLSRKAYAKVHLNYGISLLRSGDLRRSVVALTEAVRLDSSLLDRIETYLEIGTSHQPIGFNGPMYDVDFEKAQMAMNVLEESCRAAGVYGRKVAFMSGYALSLLAYWKNVPEIARRSMARAICSRPVELLSRERVLFCVKVALGKRTVSSLKKFVNLI